MSVLCEKQALQIIRAWDPVFVIPESSMPLASRRVCFVNLHELGMYIHNMGVQVAKILDADDYQKGTRKRCEGARDSYVEIGEFLRRSVVLTGDPRDTAEASVSYSDRLHVLETREKMFADKWDIIHEYYQQMDLAEDFCATQIWASIQRRNGDPRWEYALETDDGEVCT